MHKTCGVRTCLGRGASVVLVCAALVAGCGETTGTTEPTFDAVSIGAATLSGGIVGVAYAGAVVASGGDGSYTWSLASGALPAGLTLGSSNGQITGIPTAAGTANFTLQVTSGDGQTASVGLSITVLEALGVTTSSLPDGTEGSAYDQTVAAEGGDGAYAWSVVAGTLPTGLGLDAGTGQISGTPTAPGDWAFTLRAESGDGQTADVEISISVIARLSISTVSLPSGIEDAVYPTQILSAVGGEGGHTWSIVSDTLPTGLSLEGSSGEISGTPTTVGEATFTVQVESGDGQTETKDFSLSVHGVLSISTASLPGGLVGIAYDETAVAVGGDGANTWSVSAGALPDGVTLDASTGQISGTPTTAAQSTFTLSVGSGDGQVDEVDLSITILDVLVVGTTALPSGVEGAAYSAMLEAVGGEGGFTWSIATDTLPTGLALSPSTGEISGTPTTTGTATFTAQVDSDDGQSQQAVLSISIFSPLAITTGSVPDAEQGIAYDEAVAATGGDGSYTWSVSSGALPAGLDLGASTGIISGIPTAVETAAFALKVESGDGQVSEAGFGINVAQIVLTPAEFCSDNPGTAVGSFQDGNLETVIRQVLGVAPSVDLTCNLLATIAMLDAQSSGISDLTGIQNLTALDDLSLNQNSVIDLSPLSTLTTLTKLNVSNNGLSDLSPVAGLTGLVDLVAFGNSISDVSSLSALTSVRWLNLGENDVSDISAFSGMTSMWSFEMAGNPISDISALAGMVDVENVNLGNTLVSDLSPLSGLTKIELLSVTGGSVTDLSPLSGMTAMRELFVYSNPLSDLSPLTGMTALTSLHLGSTAVSDLSPVSGLTNLLTLWVEGTNVTSLDALSGMTALANLFAGNAQISDIGGLLGLTALTEVRLQFNASLADISALIDNTGMGSGDSVNLQGTSVLCTDVDTLRATGATVTAPTCP